MNPVCGRPSAPTSLTASSGNHQVVLNWGAASDDVGVSAYNIYRSDSSPVVRSPENFIGSVGGGTTTYTDTNAADAGPFFYRVGVQSP